MLKDGVFRTIGVLNVEIYQIIHPKIHSIISFPPSLLDSSLFISYLQLLAVSSVYATAIFFIRIVLGFFFPNVDLFGLGCFFVNFWAKEKRFVGDIWDYPSYWDHCNSSLIRKFGVQTYNRPVIWWQQGVVFLLISFPYFNRSVTHCFPLFLGNTKCIHIPGSGRAEDRILIITSKWG